MTLTSCSKLTDSGVSALVNGNTSLLALDVSGLEAITDTTMHVVATYCKRLQGLNITKCKKSSNESLVAVAKNCRYLKRVSAQLPLSGCDKTLMHSLVKTK